MDSYSIKMLICYFGIFLILSTSSAQIDNSTVTTLSPDLQCNETNHEEYVLCTNCERTCQHSPNLTATPTPGCACEEGYIRDETTNICYSLDQLPAGCNTTAVDDCSNSTGDADAVFVIKDYIIDTDDSETSTNSTKENQGRHPEVTTTASGIIKSENTTSNETKEEIQQNGIEKTKLKSDVNVTSGKSNAEGVNSTANSAVVVNGTKSSPEINVSKTPQNASSSSPDSSTDAINSTTPNTTDDGDADDDNDSDSLVENTNTREKREAIKSFRKWLTNKRHIKQKPVLLYSDGKNKPFSLQINDQLVDV